MRLAVFCFLMAPVLCTVTVPDALAEEAQDAGEIQQLNTPPPAQADGKPPAEPGGYRMDDYRKPVPTTLKGATVIDTITAENLWEDNSAIFIDVFPKSPKPKLPEGTLWIDPKRDTIAKGLWLPNVGYGALTDDMTTYFKGWLEKLRAEHPSKTLVFFCLRDCWMSWNAAKRALSWGYDNIAWYPDGTDGWIEAGNDVEAIASGPDPKKQ